MKYPHQEGCRYIHTAVKLDEAAGPVVEGESLQQQCENLRLLCHRTALHPTTEDHRCHHTLTCWDFTANFLDISKLTQDYLPSILAKF